VLIVRGTTYPGYKRPHYKVAGYHVCKKCKRTMYSGTAPWYLYPQPPDDVELFDGRCGTLIVPERIAARIDFTGIRGLRITKLKVLSEPKDGFPPLFTF